MLGNKKIFISIEDFQKEIEKWAKDKIDDAKKRHDFFVRETGHPPKRNNSKESCYGIAYLQVMEHYTVVPELTQEHIDHNDSLMAEQMNIYRHYNAQKMWAE